MAKNTPEISTLEDLRAFVLSTVCTGQLLSPDMVRVSEQVLLRQGKPCGLQFTLNGPRSVQFSVIWDSVGQSILFYDCNGVRFLRHELTMTADLAKELAALAGQSE